MIAQFTALRKFLGHNTGKGSTGKVPQTLRVEEKEPTIQTDQGHKSHRVEDQRGESCPQKKTPETSRGSTSHQNIGQYMYIRKLQKFGKINT